TVGTLPVQIPFNAGPSVAFQFGYMGGIVSPYYSMYSLGAEGLAANTENVNAYRGISGYLCEDTFSLAGVFLTDAAPQAPAPATLNFTTNGIGRNFATLTPLVGQVFFIGDGLTDGGTPQSFYAPTGATRLFLGFVDAPGFTGNPGNYGDNTGSLSISVA